MSDPPSLCFSHFRVLAHEDGSVWTLGAGAMGMTYKAYDDRLRVEVALKVITPSKMDDPKVQALFLREARAAARVRHSNVASVLSLDDTPGNFFYAMEFVPGVTLQDFLRERGPLSPAVALSLAIQVAHGLEAIHAQGIVHRDLKPTNLMLLPAPRSREQGSTDPPEAEEWLVKVIDFGLARAFEGESLGDGSAANTTGFRGTVLYASPEQCQESVDIDGRSDQYALGCLLWEMMLGSPPFQGKSQHELMNQHVSRQPPMQLLAKLPSGVQAIVARLLVKDPEGRFPSAEAAAKAMERCREKIISGEDPVTQLDAGSSSTVLPATLASGTVSVSSSRPGRFWTSTKVFVWFALIALGLAAGTWWLRGKNETAKGLAATGVASSSVRTSEKSVAVLPFENLSEEKQNEFFAIGVQEEILTDLSRVAELKVISRSSVMQYKSGVPRNLREVGQALDVAYVLVGSVQRAGGKVRVSAQLIDTRTDAHVWAQRYDRDLADVFAIQSEVAEAIAAQLNARISPAEKAAIGEIPTRDLAAYELYLRAQQMAQLIFRPGHTQSTQSDSEQIIRLLNEAVSRDPNFVEAWCALAARHDLTYFSGDDRTPERLALAQAAVDTAVRAKPHAGETHLARALHAYWGFRDYAAARRELELAGRSLPNNAQIYYRTGLIDRRQGRWEDSSRNVERALELDPHNQNMLTELAVSYMQQRHFNDATRTVRRLEALRPGAVETQILSGEIQIARDAFLQPMQIFIDAQLALPGRPPANVIEEALDLALLKRNPEAARRATKLLAEGYGKFGYFSSKRFPLSYFTGVIARMEKDEAAALAAFDIARTEAASQWAQQRENPKAISVLAQIDSELGRHEEALREARQACELIPVASDALLGAELEIVLAGVEARAGQIDQAMERLNTLSNISTPINYGDLKLNSLWDPLRADPRFEAMLTKLAPQGPPL